MMTIQMRQSVCIFSFIAWSRQHIHYFSSIATGISRHDLDKEKERKNALFAVSFWLFLSHKSLPLFVLCLHALIIETMTQNAHQMSAIKKFVLSATSQTKLAQPFHSNSLLCFTLMFETFAYFWRTFVAKIVLKGQQQRNLKCDLETF